MGYLRPFNTRGYAENVRQSLNRFDFRGKIVDGIALANNCLSENRMGMSLRADDWACVSMCVCVCMVTSTLAII